VCWIALVALLNALAWGILVPPFHVPDENAHVAYVQYLAETGRLPEGVADRPPYSPEINGTLEALRFYEVVGRTENRPPGRSAEIASLDEVRDGTRSRVGSGDVSSATNNPPLYYGAQAAAYWASPSHDLLMRVALMRIVSALLAGVAALFGALFVRELLPHEPWAWIAGGLAIATQPLLGFMGGGVNNDIMLFAASAAMFFALARIFRRGLTPARAAGVCLALAVGVLAKATMIAFVAAVAFALLWAVARGRPQQRGAALRAGAVGIAVVALPALLYVLLSATVWDRPIWGAAAVAAPADDVSQAGGGSLREQISYTWQLYLPRFGVFTTLHPVANPPVDLWFNGFVGRFGWLDYGFPQWVYDVAKWFAAVVIALAASTLVRSRRALRGRAMELTAYVLAAGGLAVLIGAAGYSYWINTGGERFEQARYLLPLLPLYGAIVALAIRGAGRRAGPSLAAVAVVVMIGWSVYAQLITVLRFYS
jgi:4-amino-4-deoxy-L-arabinose transferase-like glycosyltransferase